MTNCTRFSLFKSKYVFELTTVHINKKGLKCQRSKRKGVNRKTDKNNGQNDNKTNLKLRVKRVQFHNENWYQLNFVSLYTEASVELEWVWYMVWGNIYTCIPIQRKVIFSCIEFNYNWWLGCFCLTRIDNSLSSISCRDVILLWN